MPRIFGLRHCLQEVQDSILFDDEPLMKESRHAKFDKFDFEEDKNHWLDQELNLHSSECDIIQIPGKIWLSFWAFHVNQTKSDELNITRFNHSF